MKRIVHIKCYEDLYLLDDLSKDFVLDCDLDLKGLNFKPIGSKEKPFSGSFNGNGHTISNYYLECTHQKNIGFFGYNTGSIYSLELENSNIIGVIDSPKNIGTICGTNEGVIEDVRISGNTYVTINNNSLYLSPVVSINYGEITNVYSKINTICNTVNKGKLYFGGLVCETKAGKIETTESDGNVILNGNKIKAALFAHRINNSILLANKISFATNEINGEIFYNKFYNKKTSVCDSNIWRDNTNNDVKLNPKEYEVRRKAETYMRAMGSIEWIPNKTLVHNCTCNAKVHKQVFKKGVKQYGLPYTHKAGSLERFLYAFNEDGTLKSWIKPTGYDGFDMYMGNDCSTAVYWALCRVDDSVKYHWTWDGHPAYSNGMLPLGDYEYDCSLNTGDIIKKNTREKILECYALLNIGSPMVHINNAGGHFRMCAECPVIYRNLTDEIDPMSSYVLIHEQGDGLLYDNPKLGKSQSWLIDKKYSLEKLLKEEFIPLTIKAYINKKVSPDRVKYIGDNTINSGIIKTNYRIISVQTVLEDDNNSKLWSKTLFTGVNAYEGHGNKEEAMPIINTQKDYAKGRTHLTRLKKEYNARIHVTSFDLNEFRYYFDEQLLKKGKCYKYIVNVLLSSGNTIKACEFKIKG